MVDEVEIEQFVQRHDFATVITSSAEGLLATHVPVVVRRQASDLVIVGHVARANLHWKAMNGLVDSLVIFHGPHHYISPSWYVDGPAVPTWNYAVIHAYGKPQARQDGEFIESVLDELVQRYESKRAVPWRIEKLPAEYHDRSVSRIVGFEMQVFKLEAKFKFGQNRRPEDQAGTIAGLEREGSHEATTLAALMRPHLNHG